MGGTRGGLFFSVVPSSGVTGAPQDSRPGLADAGGTGGGVFFSLVTSPGGVTAGEVYGELLSRDRSLLGWRDDTWSDKHTYTHTHTHTRMHAHTHTFAGIGGRCPSAPRVLCVTSCLFAFLSTSLSPSTPPQSSGDLSKGRERLKKDYVNKQTKQVCDCTDLVLVGKVASTVHCCSTGALLQVSLSQTSQIGLAALWRRIRLLSAGGGLSVGPPLF